jgi:subtilisin family serine protease
VEFVSEDLTFERLAEQTGNDHAEVPVAAIDTGFDLTHPLFASRLWGDPQNPGAHGFDFMEDDAERPRSAHGTHVLGLLTEGTEALRGMALQITNRAGLDHVDQTARAIEFASERGVRVVNLSHEYRGAGIEDLVAVMRAHPEVLFVLAAGNHATRISSEHAATSLTSNVLPNLVVVAGTTVEKDELATGSSFGQPFVELAAVGEEVISLKPGGGLSESLMGTSVAAPQVANLAAKCLALIPAWRDAEGERARQVPALLEGLLSLTSTENTLPASQVVARGAIQPQAAMQVAALVGLLTQGKTEAQAAQALGLSAEEAVQWMPTARWLAAR